MLTKSQLETHVAATIQCDLGSQFFEKLDFRKCLRCGLNDKIQAGSCCFHPAKCHNKAGAGSYLYSPEWHKCREDCKSDSGCMSIAQHYYGTHLPSVSARSKSRRRVDQQVRGKLVSQEVMTDVSLLFNPFKQSTTPSNRSSDMSPTT